MNDGLKDMHRELSSDEMADLPAEALAQAGAQELDAVIRQNLEGLGYGE